MTPEDQKKAEAEARKEVKAEEAKVIGAMLRRLRAKAGMKVSEVAYQAKTLERNIQRWEKGDNAPEAAELLRVLAVFGFQVPFTPRYKSISSELRRLRESIDEMLASADTWHPPTRHLEEYIAEVNGPTPLSPERRARIQQVADAYAAAIELASRSVEALRARLEDVDTGH